MAFNKYVNGAWQECGTPKRYANGAWQTCGSVKRYTNGAWADMSAKPVYYLQNGVTMNGGTWWNGDGIYARHNKNGYFEFENAFEYGNSNAEFYIPASADLVGKTVYVVTDSAYDYVCYGSSMMSHNGNVYSTKLTSTTEQYQKIWFDLSGYETISIKDIYVK